MRLDAQGYFHFIDRIGHTLRRRGAGVIDAATYGISVPGADGRASMAAIVIDDDFELNGFADYLARRLPAYAHPIFLRIKPALETTETFKLKNRSCCARDLIQSLLESRFISGIRVGLISLAGCGALFRNRGGHDPPLKTVEFLKCASTATVYDVLALRFNMYYIQHRLSPRFLRC